MLTKYINFKTHLIEGGRMISVEHLQSIVLLSGLNREMMQKLAEKAKIVNIRANRYLFKEGDSADTLYSVLEGKVALGVANTSHIMVKVRDILPGKSFGISSLVETSPRICITDAKTVMDTKLVKWDAGDLEILFQLDPQLGFRFMKRLSRVLKDRLSDKDSHFAAVA